MKTIMKYKKNVYQSLMLVTQFSINMLVPIFGCSFLGIYLDRRLGTSFLMIFFFFIGYSTASPSSSIARTTSSTYSLHSFWLAASTITRISGSVPLSRTSIRPSWPKAFSTLATACCTRLFSRAAFLSATRTFCKICG